MPVTLTQTATPPVGGTLLDRHRSSTADANGCVFAQVPEGTYTVSLGQPTQGTPAGFLAVGAPASPPSSRRPSPQPPPTRRPAPLNSTGVVTISVPGFDEGINTQLTYGASTGGRWRRGVPWSERLHLHRNRQRHRHRRLGGVGRCRCHLVVDDTVLRCQHLPGCLHHFQPIQVCGGRRQRRERRRYSPPPRLRARPFPTRFPSGVTGSPRSPVRRPTGATPSGTNTARNAVLLAGAVGQTTLQRDTWSVVAPATPRSRASPRSPAHFPPRASERACRLDRERVTYPGILRLDGDPATLATNGLWTPTFTADTLPAGSSGTSLVTAVGQRLSSATQCLALGAGDLTGSTDPTVLVATIAPTSGTPPPSTWSNEPNFPTGTGSVTDLTCASTTCLVWAPPSSGTPEAWIAASLRSPDDWALASLPDQLASDKFPVR